MAFDGAFAYKIAAELHSAIDCHIDKIYQPSRDELVFLLRKKGFVKRLLLSAKSGTARLSFTEEKYENPAVPPMFCMLVRKHFSAARLVSIKQPSLERVIELLFEATNEMGDRVTLKIICELIGNKSNIILVNESGKIIDALRRSSIEDTERMLLPGAVYTYPEKQNKLNILDESLDNILTQIDMYKEMPLSNALLNTLDGFSPLICREIAFKVTGSDDIVLSADKTLLCETLNKIKSEIMSGGKPTLLLKSDGVPLDFTYTDIKQYDNTITAENYESYSALLDAFYAKKEAAARIKFAASDIIRLVNNLIARAEKRLNIRLNELEATKNREELRIFGELLKANLHLIKQGAKEAVVQNYYDEELKPIKIPLNPALSPSNNAAKYFKDYKKTYTAEQTLLELTEKDRLEIAYFESVLEAISRAETLADINEIRTELTEEGYLRAQKGTPPVKKVDVKSFKEYKSIEGYRILVGKNNRQNDYLTTKLASKNDLWFHTKNIAGSHVLVFCEGREVSDDTILFAAQLAAENSKAKNSSNIAVDYTPVKFVKKPNGAKAGMVIYTTNKTVYVTPKGEGNL